MNNVSLKIPIRLLCGCVVACSIAFGHAPAPAALANIFLKDILSKASVLELMLRKTAKNKCERYVVNAAKTDKEDYESLFSWLNKYEEQKCSVEEIDAIVWGWLGQIYENGRGTKQDIDKAIYYYTKSAEKGDVDIQYFLGYCLVKYKKDYKNGITWLKKAALKGDVDALYILGTIYDDETTPYFNLKEAFKYFEMGAKQGDVDCSYDLGLMYYYGDGTVENSDKAIELLQYAAERGEGDAARYLSGILFTDYEPTDELLEEAYLWLQVSKHFRSTVNEDKVLEKKILDGLSHISKAKVDAKLPQVYSEIRNRMEKF